MVVVVVVLLCPLLLLLLLLCSLFELHLEHLLLSLFTLTRSLSIPLPAVTRGLLFGGFASWEVTSECNNDATRLTPLLLTTTLLVEVIDILFGLLE